MAAILLLVAVVIVAGLGFAVSMLFWVALVLLVLWLLGWVVRREGHRWYYW